MKKILFCLFSIFCLCALVGCNEPKEDSKEEKLATYDLELKEFIDELIPTEVSDKVTLPEEYEFLDGEMAHLEWKSSNGRTIARSGRFTQNLFDEEITLSAKVYYDNLDIESSYERKVNTKGKDDVNEYKKIIESYIPNYLYKDVELVTRDMTYKTKNIFGDITYNSPDEDILKIDIRKQMEHEKEVDHTYLVYTNKNPKNQDIDLEYNVFINGINVKGVKKVTVEGRDDIKYINDAKAFLDKYFTTNQIYNKLDLPLTDENERVTLTWKSSEPTIVSDEGLLYVFEPNLTFKMTATIDYNGTIETWEKEFRTYKENELVDFVVNRMHRDEIQQYIMHVYTYDKDNYGFLPFYYQDIEMKDVVTDTTPGNKEIHYLKDSTKNQNASKLEIVTGLVPWEGKGRPQEMKSGTYVITVHDTGSPGMSAADWNEYEQHDPRTTSWNFTVGEDKIYQHIGIDEVAWHAGDGGISKFSLLDTGVKFEGYDPEITLGTDHFLHINGKPSKIRIPSWQGHEANEISGSGLYTCLGDNGNYYMADVYASGYSYTSKVYYVCTKGGNATGIGIETDIVKGVDYNQVMRNCANLVGNLLVHFNLPPDRILQHRHFSGKLCPQLMIRNGLWPNFIMMCQNEYLIKKYLPNLKLEYTTSDETLINKNGKVLKEVMEDTKVTYTVKATFEGKVKEFNFETTIKPIDRSK